jgi:DNA-binding response OmpR family regulator
MKVRILWVEGKRAESPPFAPNLRKKGYLVEVVSTGSEALTRLKDYDPDLIVVNAASMRTTGKRICQSLSDKSNGVQVVIISSPENLKQAEDGCANVSLALPFTTRKLLNRITPLLPGDEEQILHVGPIRLFLDRKLVRCQGREATLTPRLAHLLRVFMEHPGEALEREQLFKEVWNTNYTVDTRTLDVHISWLRQAIEEDPRKPRFIKTMRGLGYRLDI